MRISCVRALFGVAVIGALFAPVSHVIAAPNSPQQAPSGQTVQQFLADPSALLTQFPNGGAQMIAEIRDFAASSPEALAAIVNLLSTASADQATAIGTGLGQAALIVVKNNQAYATQIQTAVVATHNISAVVAFSTVVGGDIQLAAAAGIGGAGGGGESGTGPNGATGGSSNGTPLNFTTFSSSIPPTFSTNSSSIHASVSQTQ
jgi:hypothetical protein